MKVRKKAKIRARYNQVPHLTQDTIWKVTKTQENITSKSGKRSALSQEVTTKLKNGQHSMTNKHKTQTTKRIPKRSTALEQAVRQLLKSLNMFKYLNI